jgi:hypothetical protein
MRSVHCDRDCRRHCVGRSDRAMHGPAAPPRPTGRGHVLLPATGAARATPRAATNRPHQHVPGQEAQHRRRRASPAGRCSGHQRSAPRRPWALSVVPHRRDPHRHGTPHQPGRDHQQPLPLPHWTEVVPDPGLPPCERRPLHRLRGSSPGGAPENSSQDARQCGLLSLPGQPLSR